MREEFNLIAELREGQGKGASRRLRREGKVPAIIYGGGREPRKLSFDQNRVLQELERESFYSSILNIKVGDVSQAAIIKDIQRHPAKRAILHMDFQRIVEGEKIRMNVPIHFLNEDTAIGVKQGGGSVSHLMSDVEISCLPKDLPEYLEVDIAALDLNDMLYMSDIKLPEGVEIPELAQGEEHDQAIVSIHVIKVVEADEKAEEEVAAVDPAAVPTASDAEEDKDSE